MSGKPYVMVCVPSGITAVEERAVIDATRQAGARMPIPLKNHLRQRSALIYLFGSQLAVWLLILVAEQRKLPLFRLGGIVTSQSIRIAGDEMDDVNYYLYP